jgi:hypothetical protein
MILEELFGSFVSLSSSLLTQVPPISRERLQMGFTFIYEAYAEQDEVRNDLIHREYDEEPAVELPYYEEDISVLVQDHTKSRRTFCQSFLRSFQANLGLVITVVFILGLLTTGIVYVDLNTTNACIAWMYNNFSVPSNVRILRMAGMSVTLLPLFSWFPNF